MTKAGASAPREVRNISGHANDDLLSWFPPIYSPCVERTAHILPLSWFPLPSAAPANGHNELNNGKSQRSAKGQVKSSLYSPICKEHKAKIKRASAAGADKCQSSSGPKSSWAEETTTPLRGVNCLFTELSAAPIPIPSRVAGSTGIGI